MAPSFADRLVEGVLDRLRAESLAPGTTETGNGGMVESDFRGGMEIQRSGRLAAALRLRVEAANALDGVAEQVDAHRCRLAGGEYVDDAAAQRIFAGIHHRAGAPVAIGIEKRGYV